MIAWRFECSLIQPGTRLSPPIVTNGLGDGLLVLPSQHVRFFAGQPDPKSKTRFTLPFDIDGVPGAIEFRLNDTPIGSDLFRDELRPGSPGALAGRP